MSHLISRLRIAGDPEVRGLYLRTRGPVAVDAGHARLARGGVLSFDSYFNSFYAPQHARYTTLARVDARLRLEGDFRVHTLRRDGEGRRESLACEEVRGASLESPVSVAFSHPDGDQGQGRLFLELECLGEQGRCAGGELLSAEPPAREVALAVIVCTFRKEAYVEATVGALVADPALRERALGVYVVDNGRTLAPDAFPDPRVRLLPNPNVGGSGGFNRGLIEAVADPRHTHFLFMDDDVELDAEAVLRLYALFGYARGELAVAGSMLDLYRRTSLYEAGARYGPLLCEPLEHGRELEDSAELDALLREQPPDYGGFWFFAFSRRLVGRIGGLLPFFIKVDDMEFGLRARGAGGADVVAFPGIAIWHEPFYAKIPVWDIYYYTRNNLVANAVHRRLPPWRMLGGLTRRVVGRLMLFDYNAARMLLRGLQDFLRGPEHLRDLDQEALHGEVVAASRACAGSRQPLAGEDPAVTDPPRAGLWRKGLALATLNGHLLPAGLLSSRERRLRDGPRAWPHVGGHRTVVFCGEHTGCFRSELDHRLGLGLLGTWLATAGRAAGRWPRISRRWRDAAGELGSLDFLTRYYGYDVAPPGVAPAPEAAGGVALDAAGGAEIN